MPSVSVVFNGQLAINDNDWVAASGNYLWEPTGGGTVIDLQAKLTAAGVSWSSVNLKVCPQQSGSGCVSPIVGGVSMAYLYDAVNNTVTSLNIRRSRRACRRAT